MLLIREFVDRSPRKGPELSVSLGQPLADPRVRAEAGREAQYESSSRGGTRVLMKRRPLRRLLAVTTSLSAPSEIVSLSVDQS